MFQLIKDSVMLLRSFPKAWLEAISKPIATQKNPGKASNDDNYRSETFAVAPLTQAFLAANPFFSPVNDDIWPAIELVQPPFEKSPLARPNGKSPAVETYGRWPAVALT
jgi:hypothetical protein